jgi:hypothetical protein
MHDTELPRVVKLRLWGAIAATVAVVTINVILTRM